jgi:hypothetical protein
MPSRFQPYYPRVAARPAIQQQQATPAGGGLTKSMGDLAQAIQKAKAAQALTNQAPDDLGDLGDEAFINQSLAQTPVQVPAQPAIDNLGVLGDESLMKGSYY